MTNPDGPVPAAQPPIESGGTRVDAPSKAAAGIAGVYSTMAASFSEMGVLRSAKLLLRINKKDGFDCQSCAWPDPGRATASVAEFCENGAKAAGGRGDDRSASTREFFGTTASRELADRSDHWLGTAGPADRAHGAAPRSRRTTSPSRGTTPLPWSPRSSGALPAPDNAAFYTSGRTSNEAAFLYQLFARAFGTNNLPDCSNMCHESSGAALGQMIGIGKGCVTLADFEKADAIFIVGQNPGTQPPADADDPAGREAARLQDRQHQPAARAGAGALQEPAGANESPEGARDPVRARAPRSRDLWLPVRIDGDMAVFQGIMKEMLAAERSGARHRARSRFHRRHTRRL